MPGWSSDAMLATEREVFEALRSLIKDEPEWSALRAVTVSAVARYPADARFRLLLGTALVAEQQYREAIGQQSALVDDTTVPSELRAVALCDRAHAKLCIGESDQTVMKDLADAMTVVPHWPAPTAKLIAWFDKTGDQHRGTLLARDFVRDYWDNASREPMAYALLHLPVADLTTFIIKSASGVGVALWLDLLKGRAAQ